MEKEKIKKTVDIIMNKHKADSISVSKANPKGINTGEKTLYRPDGKRFKVLNFAGKKTKVTRILHKMGKVEKGTLWEDIPLDLKNGLNWNESHFVN
jgi:hypothetical protein